MSATNEIILETDTKVKLTTGRNVLSESVDPDFRIIFEHSKQGVYKTGDTTQYKTGLIIMTCKKDKYMEDYDDLENNLAWQPFHDYSNINANYEIKGEDTMFVGKSCKYTLEPNAWCGWEVDNENVTIEKIGIHDVVIKCDKPNELITLKAIVGNEIIEEKNILVVN